MRRSLVLLATLLALVLGTAGPVQAAATEKQPILFVHGYGSDASTWNTMVANFTAAGYIALELFPISYSSAQTNVDIAAELAVHVDDIRAQTGWETIDVVTHSMGGLSSRYYLKNLGGTDYVDEWVSLGGPNHGTNTSLFCFDLSCKDMRRNSPFLAQLNAGDETPGAVQYATWTSPCDVVINPDSSVALIGARNVATACIQHTNLQNNKGIFNQVLRFVTS